METSTFNLQPNCAKHVNSDIESSEDERNDSDDDLNQTLHPLHNSVSNWQQFLQLDPPSDILYEFVDNKVLVRPRMPGGESGHDTYITSCNSVAQNNPNVRISTFATPSMLLYDHESVRWTRVYGRTLRSSESQSTRLTYPSASNGHDTGDSDFKLCYLDYSADSKYQEGSESSSTPRDENSVRLYQYVYPFSTSLRYGGEVTSKSTRPVDLTKNGCCMQSQGFLCTSSMIFPEEREKVDSLLALSFLWKGPAYQCLPTNKSIQKQGAMAIAGCVSIEKSILEMT